MVSKLKKIREAKGLSQFELAKLSDITPADISRLENNKIFAYPGWRERLARALGVEEKEIWPNS